jgi:hypothetical protein
VPESDTGEDGGLPALLVGVIAGEGEEQPRAGIGENAEISTKLESSREKFRFG